jgi:four helix bundle protein
MTPEELRSRLTAFAVAVTCFCKPLFARPDTRNIADQLSRAATSVASNYRVACRARSKREFISKIGIALEEADEAVGWLEVLRGIDPSFSEATAPLLKEAREIVAILSASRVTASRSLNRQSPIRNRE